MGQAAEYEPCPDMEQAAAENEGIDADERDIVIKDVMITVESRKEDADGDIESMSFVTEGTLGCGDGQCKIVYQESEVTGMDGTTTTLQVEKGSVLLIRHGTLSSLLVFEKGKTHHSEYETQFGAVQIGVTARRVDVDMTDEGGKVQIDYTLEYNGAQGGRNSISLDVRPR